MKKQLYLGVDVGSVTIKIVLSDEKGDLFEGVWLRNQGSPIESVKKALKELKQKLVERNVFDDIEVLAVGTTGSARYLIKSIIGGDIAKTEIIAHATASLHEYPDVSTILEIGGQDSKIIILRDGIVSDFAMNSVCAAGTGSFLDHQAARLGIPIEEFGDYALKSKNPVAIAGRCTVFAESDMVHKAQMGYDKKDIIRGLCNSLVRNYLNNVGKGKEIRPPIVFQGGVSANKGIVKAFQDQLGYEIKVPKHYILMGALGASYLAREFRYKIISKKGGFKTNFRGFDVMDIEFKTSTFNCHGCPNQCEIVQIEMQNDVGEDEIVARWGDRCGKWEVL
ncbi:MAG: acyl-CoA dehydratase activase [Promethearchaeota archaeon]